MKKNFLILILWASAFYANSDIHANVQECLLGLTHFGKEIQAAVDLWQLHEAERALVPRQFGYIEGYQLIRSVGEGANGTLWLARDANGYEVAIKVVPKPHNITAEVHYARLKNEEVQQNLVNVAQYKSNSPHRPFFEAELKPGIAETGGQPYFIMPFFASKTKGEVAAPTLADLLTHKKSKQMQDEAETRSRDLLAGRTLTLQQREQLWEQYSEAQKILYQTNVVHGDLKPANIIVLKDSGVNPDGSAKLLLKVIDFGYATQPGGRPAGAGNGEVWGTPLYISPTHFVWPLSRFENDNYASSIIYQELVLGRNILSVKETHERVVLGKRPRVFNPVRLKNIPSPHLLEHSMANIFGLTETAVERSHIEMLAKKKDKTDFYLAVTERLRAVRKKFRNYDLEPKEEMAKIILSHEGMIEALAQGKLLTGKEEIADLISGVMELAYASSHVDKNAIGIMDPNPHLLYKEFFEKFYYPAAKAGKISGDPSTYCKDIYKLQYLYRYKA